MTLIIEVSGELEAALKAHASELGLTAEGIARQVLAQALTPSLSRKEADTSNASGTAGVEKARAFVHWAKSHRETPPLSDESISRASMYPDRW